MHGYTLSLFILCMIAVVALVVALVALIRSQDNSLQTEREAELTMLPMDLVIQHPYRLPRDPTNLWVQVRNYADQPITHVQITANGADRFQLRVKDLGDLAEVFPYTDANPQVSDQGAVLGSRWYTYADGWSNTTPLVMNGTVPALGDNYMILASGGDLQLIQLEDAQWTVTKTVSGETFAAADPYSTLWATTTNLYGTTEQTLDDTVTALTQKQDRVWYATASGGGGVLVRRTDSTEDSLTADGDATTAQLSGAAQITCAIQNGTDVDIHQLSTGWDVQTLNDVNQFALLASGAVVYVWQRRLYWWSPITYVSSTLADGVDDLLSWGRTKVLVRKGSDRQVIQVPSDAYLRCTVQYRVV